MQKKTIAIIGYGYVGKGMERFFDEKFDIVLYDPHQGHADRDVVNNADLAVVCVPTAMQEDGSVDLGAVDETFSWLTTPVVLIKSTIPPGTTASLIEKYDMGDRLCFSPEFVGEGGYPVPYWENVPHPSDMKMHSFFVFGGNKAANQKVIPFFERVVGAHARFIQTDSTSAELMKYMENTWIATKVTFCNEFYDIAEHYGVDYKELRELWLLDGRVGRSHTVVYPEKRGFDGKCIPKDTNGLVNALRNGGYEPQLLASVLAVNEIMRAKNPTEP